MLFFYSLCFVLLALLLLVLRLRGARFGPPPICRNVRLFGLPAPPRCRRVCRVCRRD